MGSVQVKSGQVKVVGRQFETGFASSGRGSLMTMVFDRSATAGPPGLHNYQISKMAMRVLAIAAAVIGASAALGNNASLYRFDAWLCVPVRAVCMCICWLCARSPRVNFIVIVTQSGVHDNAPSAFHLQTTT
jgi:hypothetical protein